MDLFKQTTDWRDLDDPPLEGTNVEIKSARDVPLRAHYSKGKFYVDGGGRTLVAYANAKGWRPL